MPPQPADTPASRRYTAFISYSHADAKWATWLHRSLERFVVPAKLRPADAKNAAPRKTLAPVFIDRAEFASSADLTESVRQALENSLHLIVVCSPKAAASRWVNEEVRLFRQMGRSRNILCLLVDGEPAADAAAGASCYPATLRFQLDAAGALTSTLSTTPLGADVRPRHDAPGDALLKLIAGMLGVPFDQLRQRARERQRRLVAAAAITGFAVISAIGIAAYRAREAQSVAAAAQRAELAAKGRYREYVANFNSSLRQANPEEQLPGAVMRDPKILAALVASYQGELDPSNKAELAMAYVGWGQFREGKRWSEDAQKTYSQSPEATDADRAIVATILGEVLFARGDYAEAIKWLKNAVKQSDAEKLRATDVRSRALTGLGEALIQADRNDEADTALNEALTIDRRLHKTDHPEIARDLSLLAMNQYYRGNLDAAAQGYEIALAMHRATLPEGNARIAEDLNALGSIYFAKQNHVLAEKYFAEALPVYQRYYGNTHPDTAILLNNLGRVILERGDFRASLPLMLTSIRANEAEESPSHEIFAFSYDSLGLAEMGLGHFDAAATAFEKALNVAMAAKHRMRGPVLLDTADLQCRQKHYAAGLELIQQARPFLLSDYGDKSWRNAMADSIEAGCRVANGDRAAKPHAEEQLFGPAESPGAGSPLHPGRKTPLSGLTKAVAVDPIVLSA